MKPTFWERYQCAAKKSKLCQRTTVKRIEDWVTGDEAMTGAQRSYLETLCREAGEEFDPNLSKAQASERIDELQKRTGRGRDH
jgi:hypothetical protein